MLVVPCSDGMVWAILTRRKLRLAGPIAVMALAACFRMFEGRAEDGGSPADLAAHDQPAQPDLTGAEVELAKLSEQSRGAAAFNGGSYLVVWADRDASSGRSVIYGRLLSPAGAAIGARLQVAEATSPGVVRDPDVATLGGAFLVTWRRETAPAPAIYTIQAHRVSAAGSLQGSVIDVHQTDGLSLDEPAVAASDPLGTYLVAWREQVADLAYRVWDRPVGATGDLGALKSVSGGSAYKSASSICAGSTTFLVTWTTEKVTGRLVSETGEQVVPIFEISGGKGDRSHSAYDGANFLAVWEDERDQASSGTDIYGQRVTPGGTLAGATDGIPISTAAGNQTSPRVTFCGGRYLVVFADERQGGSALFMQAVATDGTLVETTADNNTLLYASSSGVSSPSVTCGGAAALVTWVEGTAGSYSLKLLLVPV